MTRLADPTEQHGRNGGQPVARLRPAVHPLTAWARLGWRARGVTVWALQRVTRSSWWNRTTVPGLLVVATNSLLAEKAVAKFLARRRRFGLFGVRAFENLVDRQGDKGDGPRRLVTAAWRLGVARGMERAVLFDLMHFVALVLEREGGYEGIDPHLSMAIAEETVAAHQARRVSLASFPWQNAAASWEMETLKGGRVEFQAPVHDGYLKMISDGFSNKRPVTVAMIDSNVDPADLADGVGNTVGLGAVYPDMADLPTLAHGAVTASIIGTLAPTASLVVYPVAGPEGTTVPDETKVMFALQLARAADVVVMCLQLRTVPPNARRGRSRWS